MNITDKETSRLMVINPETGFQFDDHVISVNVGEGWMDCFDTITVWDADDEKEVEVIAKESDQRFTGPGTKYIVKTYRRYCDFDVVERETGLVVAEARYISVTSRI